MNIGNVIRKYRRGAGLTQEEMANRLGVTTPAVNKWENGNSKPDIELLAPIARLLHISLDTLLSFREDLTPAEIGEIVKQMDRMFEVEEFDTVYEWALKKVKEYPDCNLLIWQIAVILDARRMLENCVEPEKYDKQINAWYEIALKDENEGIRHRAADSLFGFYLRKKEYAKAESYLEYFSDYDPMKKIHQGSLYKDQGKTEEAYKIFESVLFSEYQTLNFSFSFILNLAIEENDMESARILSEKMSAMAGIFDMGKYNECSAMLEVMCAEKNVEGTYRIVEQLLQNVDRLGDFQKSMLFRHMKFKETDSSYYQEIKERLIEEFRESEEFGYMNEHEGWKALMQ